MAMIAGAAGLAGGLALGVTGLASAAGSDPTPTPNPTKTPKQTAGQWAGGPRFGPGGFGGGGRGGHGPGRRGGFDGGLVSAVTDSSLTLRTPDGSQTVSLTSATTYYQGQTKTTRSAVSVGEVVAVRVADPKATPKVASRVTVQPAQLAGFVTGISGSTITVADESGFTRTIRTSTSTTYQKDGAAGKASDITVGAFVHAVGSVDSNGTTLDATKVSVGRPARPVRDPATRPSGAPGTPGVQPGSASGFARAGGFGLDG